MEHFSRQHASSTDQIQDRFRKCSRCGCGLLPTTTICEFCGGVLSHLAPVGNEVIGVVCFVCGAQSRPDCGVCVACGEALPSSCPRCGNAAPISAANCPVCTLARRDFFAECVRRQACQAESRLRQRKLNDRIDNVVALLLVAGSIVISWSQGLQSDAPEWQLSVLITLLYLVMWALGKAGR